MFAGKPNGTLLTNEVKEQIDDAAVSTSKAFSAVRRARVCRAIYMYSESRRSLDYVTSVDLWSDIIAM